MRALVTGATGCVGSNLCELLASKGHRVRALVRTGSDAAFLKSLGVELLEGDIMDEGSLRAAVDGMDVIFHCAAVVSDWTSLEEMRKVNVRGLERLLHACRLSPPRRFVYVSSLVVLGMGRQENLDERAPYVFTGDNYNTTKIEAEKMLRSFASKTGFPATIVRAPYVYGPRDRQMFPRILTYLRSGKYAYIGGGGNPFTLVYAKNLADGLLRVAESPQAEGQIYTITDGAAVTRRELIERIADGMGLPRPTKNIPYPMAVGLCAILEISAKVFKLRSAPPLNRFRMKFMHTYLTFDISKARRELGYGPAISFEQGLRESLQWFKQNC
ncbi:MAG: NAD-dependent epimerase/dehydratase family protein [Candidatus Aureabacteria bacterium]|nr:NAD-dependent epimerase/dehydratase family protein [Candidatus Auribacterota bacterium]